MTIQSGSPEVEEAEGAAPVQRLPVVILVLYSVKPHVLQNISDGNQLYWSCDWRGFVSLDLMNSDGVGLSAGPSSGLTLNLLRM